LNTGKKPISVSIICFNEEENIRRCLESIKWADEIIILDSFSTDKTLEICREYTDKIYQHVFDGYIEQKNRALDLCTNDWVLSVDADEVVSDKLAESIADVYTDSTEYTGFKVPRRVFYLGKPINHGGWYPDYKIRFFNKNHARWGGINPHDTVILDGKSSLLKGDLHHYPYSDISSHMNQINKFTGILSEEYENKGEKPGILNLTIRPFYKFIKMYLLKLGFLDGKRGFLIAVMGSFYVFLKFAKLFERKNKL
jgi:glycosyltransferase involved in cell wall biosynthesis